MSLFRSLSCSLVVSLLTSCVIQGEETSPAFPSSLPGEPGAWDLVWQDEFTGPDAALDATWEAQNGPSTHILCSRWRENVALNEGVLRLMNRRETRGGQEWTSGSIHTRQTFQYGYFECRYRYAAAEGTNNSFWLMPVGALPAGGTRFEIDINEGHYPNEVNTNLHNHSEVKVVNGRKTHLTMPKAFQFGSQPNVRVQLETPVTTRRIRLSSQHGQHIHIDQLQLLGIGAEASDLAREAGVTVTTSGNLASEDTSRTAIDGVLGTRWVSQRDGEKWIEVTLAGERTIGGVQFTNGWLGSQGSWNNLLDQYRLDYHNGTDWVAMSTHDVKAGAFNFARDFQVLGLDWNEHELVFYLNGREIRRIPNQFCHNPAPVWLSQAIIPWAGRVSEAIHGTAMEVDYVRVYRRR